MTSSGTGGWHVGNPMDRRAAATLTAAGYDATRHRARQYDASWADRYDLVLAMDRDNLADLGGVSPRVRLFRDFDPVGTGGDVPDPYYGGDAGFEEVLTMVERTSASLVDLLVDRPSTAWAPMTRQPLVARHAEELLGSAVVATAPVAGGDVCVATKLRLSDGTTALMKTLNNAPPQFFASEAAGLSWLAEAGGVAVPDVLAADDGCLILRWVEPGRPSADAAPASAAPWRPPTRPAPRRTAATPTASSPGCRCSTSPRPTWAEFFAQRRVLPYLKLARDNGRIWPTTTPSASRASSPRLAQLVPEEPPARLHGDLWNGNVLWGTEQRVWVIDPAAHGGHRETDLAMLALFGLPHLPRVLDAYAEASPLADGWQDRAGVHQLFPLLVHACLFGGGYGARAGATAARYL